MSDGGVAVGPCLSKNTSGEETPVGSLSIIQCRRENDEWQLGSRHATNLLGSIVVVWSLWRLRHPSLTVGLYDAVARSLFAVWQLFAVANGASFLILGFTVFEVAFAIAQWVPVTDKQQMSEPVGQARSVQMPNIHL